MKRIEVIADETSVEPLTAALIGAGIHDVVITEVNGFVGRSESRFDRGAYTSVSFAPKFKLEAVVYDDEFDGAIDVLVDMLDSKVIVDGRLYVVQSEEPYVISNG